MVILDLLVVYVRMIEVKVREGNEKRGLNLVNVTALMILYRLCKKYSLERRRIVQGNQGWKRVCG